MRSLPEPSPCSPATRGIRWLPRIDAGYRFAAGEHVTSTITAAWLLMTELRAYIEDLAGARDIPDAAALVKIKIAELLLQVDAVLGRVAAPPEMHRLPMLMAYGLGDVAAMDGATATRVLGLDVATDAAEVDRLTAVLEELLAAFPSDLVDALQPENQGHVLRFLRSANKACERVGCDAGFLAPLMTSL
ncbi:DUF6031 family protein [Variovorax atrisoli]|uniref:DUF6031 family protein n=1 Tax=Variovorax atrisoli TaxID=3394203 RepID=UPI00160DE589|nr:DUF6031 family protein [Variovorax sp. BK613]MBB3641800.1 hypothetical protein [Variovorax sp. BK613]